MRVIVAASSHVAMPTTSEAAAMGFARLQVTTVPVPNPSAELCWPDTCVTCGISGYASVRVPPAVL
jgi:hypothetical protein